MPSATVSRKKVRDADASRARVFAAAAEEFAAHGFDGAKVDRIAARATVNKAMLYYHYTDKAALYSAVVGDMFSSVAVQLRAMRAAGGSPEDQLRAFIDTIAREGQLRPHFPGMWLRELAAGGANLDARNFTDIGSIVSTLAEILRDGEAAGRFSRMPPFLVQMGIVGPLFLFLATGPMRQRLKATLPGPVPDVSPDTFIDYVKRMSLGALDARSSVPASTPKATASAPARRRATKRVSSKAGKR